MSNGTLFKHFLVIFHIKKMKYWLVLIKLHFPTKCCPNLRILYKKLHFTSFNIINGSTISLHFLLCFRSKATLYFTFFSCCALKHNFLALSPTYVLSSIRYFSNLMKQKKIRILLTSNSGTT